MSSPIEITGLVAAPICSSACVLTWNYAGRGHDGFDIERKGAFEEDPHWRHIATLPPAARRYESAGMLGGNGRAWRHRIRPRAGGAPWTATDPTTLPDSPGGPRGTRIVPATAAAPRNISGSLIALAGGELYFLYTASANLEDYARSWLPAIALTPSGSWEDRGIPFPSRPDWTCVSRPSFMRMPNGHIGLTYSIGKPKIASVNDGSTSDFIHRTAFRVSVDEAKTWSDERIISGDRYDYELVNSNGARNIVLSNGRLLTNVHVCKPPPLAKFDPYRGENAFNEVMGTYLLLSDDNGKSWQRVPRETDQFFFTADDPYNRRRIGFWEIAVAEYSPGKLLMLGRNASGWLYETRSEDFGATWSPLARTEIPYPIAPPNLTIIPGTSTLVLLANPHVSYTNTWDGGFRSVLATQLSDDCGRTWHGYRELEYDGITGDDFWSLYSYPDFAWTGDTLHVIYSRKFQELYHQALTKDWLLGRD